MATRVSDQLLMPQLYLQTAATCRRRRGDLSQWTVIRFQGFDAYSLFCCLQMRTTTKQQSAPKTVLL